MSAKRNDPCSCGSGKKYKHCCLQNPAGHLQPEDLRQCLSSLYPSLENHAKQRFGSAIEPAGWQSFSRWGIAAIAHEKEAYQAAFTDWWLYCWLPDDQGLADERFLAKAPDHAIAADYLATHRIKPDSLEQRVIERALTSPYSFYAVLSVGPGNRLGLKEIYTQKSVTVDGDSATSYTQGELLFCAVLSLDGASTLLGAMPKALKASCTSRIETHREKWSLDVGRAIDQRLLYLHDSELRRYYFVLLNQQQQAKLH